MIGNDIIDLNLAEKQSDWQRKGFLEKQFTAEEQHLIRSSKDSFQTVWLLWSMKEAAYKIWVQQHKTRKFSPLSFRCKLTSKDEGIVKTDNEMYFTFSRIDRYYISTLACLDKSVKVLSWMGSPLRIEENIKEKLQEETGFSALEIEKRKSDIGVPNYFHKNKPLTKSCSISHHGNYGYYSILLG